MRLPGGAISPQTYGGNETMAWIAAKTFMHHEGRRRVTIFRRTDGTFGFFAEEYVEDPCGEGWLPAIDRIDESEAVCDSEQTAEREARSRVKWLMEGMER